MRRQSHEDAVARVIPSDAACTGSKFVRRVHDSSLSWVLTAPALDALYTIVTD